MKAATLFAAGLGMLAISSDPARASEAGSVVLAQAQITPAPSGGGLRGNSAISGDTTLRPERNPVLEQRRIETNSYADRVPPRQPVRPNIPEKRTFGQPRPKWAPRNPPWVHDQFDRR